MTPNVSIIIPCFNGARWLRTCIQSILNQSVELEIIVVDDFSTDESWNIITQLSIEYSSVFIGLKNDHKGGNLARRFGFNHSTGQFIQWLDVDDELLPGKLKAQIEFLEVNPLIDIVYSDWQIDQYNEKDELISSEFKLSTKVILSPPCSSNNSKYSVLISYNVSRQSATNAGENTNNFFLPCLANSGITATVYGSNHTSFPKRD